MNLGRGFALDEKAEPALGSSVGVQATNRYPLLQDKNLTQYVTLVGRTIGASSPFTLDPAGTYLLTRKGRKVRQALQNGTVSIQ